MQKPYRERKKIRTNFTHGLGDCVQFTIVLKHIQKHRPNWIVEAAASSGRSSCFRGLCQKCLEPTSPATPSTEIMHVNWAEPSHFNEYRNIPLTKVTHSLHKQFRIKPDESLYEYQIQTNSADRNLVKQYLSTLPPSKGVVGIHYKGTSSSHTKNLPDGIIKKLCNRLVFTEYTPVILDWNNSCRFADNTHIFCPGRGHYLWKHNKLAEATVIAALIEEMSLFIGVDSGPLHVAGATDTLTLGVWTRHHPLNYFDLCGNVHHLLPRNSRANIKGRDRRAAENYFQDKYKHTYYRNLDKEFMNAVSYMLEEELIEKDAMSNITTPKKWWVLQPHSTLLSKSS